MKTMKPAKTLLSLGDAIYQFYTNDAMLVNNHGYCEGNVFFTVAQCVYFGKREDLNERNTASMAIVKEIHNCRVQGRICDPQSRVLAYNP